MRQLTLKGFLRQYCCLLADLDTRSYARLVNRAENGWSRVVEPLVLLAAVEGKLPLLSKRAGDLTRSAISQFEASFHVVKSVPIPESELLEHQEDLPGAFRKVLVSYVAEKGKVSNERRLTGVLREMLLPLMEEKKLTGYRLCKDLGLNSGNVYAYLANGNVKCVSKETALRMFEYAEAYQP